MANLNRMPFIERCISSYLEFSGNKELIVIDGLSTDGSAEYLKKFADVFISEKDSSVYEAWNKGISKATGDWIFFLNTDDELMNGFNELFLRLPDINNTDIVIFNTIIEDHENLLNHQIEPMSPRFTYFEIIALPSLFNAYLFSKTTFSKVGNFNVQFKNCADQDFLWRCKTNGANFVRINLTCYKYKIHGDSKTLSGEYFFFEEEYEIAKLNLEIAPTAKNKRRSARWVKWEEISASNNGSAGLRFFKRLLHPSTFLIQLFQIWNKVFHQ